MERRATRAKSNHPPSAEGRRRIRQGDHSGKRSLDATGTNDKFSPRPVRAELEGKVWINLLQLTCECIKDLLPFSYLTRIETKQFYFVVNEPIPKLFLRTHVNRSYIATLCFAAPRRRST